VRTIRQLISDLGFDFCMCYGAWGTLHQVTKNGWQAQLSHRADIIWNSTSTN
jgi:hypothetical protein